MEEDPIRLITWNCSKSKYDEKRAKLLSLNPSLAIMQEASQTNLARGQQKLMLRCFNWHESVKAWCGC